MLLPFVFGPPVTIMMLSSVSISVLGASVPPGFTVQSLAVVADGTGVELGVREVTTTGGGVQEYVSVEQ